MESSDCEVRPSDRALWSQAVEGDASAFGSLFERHADRVYNHCFRRTGSWDAAQEATSMVFLEAWRRRADVLFTTESVLPWLLAVANNVIRHRWRAESRYRELLARIPTPTPDGDHADAVAGRVDTERAMSGVLAACADLSGDDRDVLSLCLWSELSYEDAAAVLGVPVGTVRSRLSRARSRLRERLTTVPDSTVATLPEENRDE